MRFSRSRQEEVTVNLTPLIDVVFLLLIFFMVTTTFTRETQLQINLPDSQSETVAENSSLIEVLVDRTGTYAVNGQVLIKHDIESLKQALKLVSEGNVDRSIVITADAQAPHQAFIHALDAVAQQGFSKVSITTQAQSTQ